MNGRIRGPAVDNEIRVVTASDATFVMANENVLCVKRASGLATAVTLPATPPVGRKVWIVDAKGDAASNNITISPAAGTINGGSTLLIAENYGAVALTYNGTEWNVTGSFAAASGTFNSATITSATITNATITNGTVTTATITNGIITTATITTNNVTTENVAGVFSLTDIASVNAAGSVIANGTPLTHCVNVVAGADDAKGVVLPASTPGQICMIYSSQATNGLKVYAPINSAINGGSVNAAVVVEGKSLGLFICTNSTNWASIFTVNS